MPRTIWDEELQTALDRARAAYAAHTPAPAGAADALPGTLSAAAELPRGDVTFPPPFPSPAEWRDLLIYQLLIDRFNNPTAAPRAPWNREANEFQGGTFEGIRQQLDYLARLGVGAIWLSPVLKNCQYSASTYHGYGIQDLIAIDPRFASDPARAAVEPALVEQELHDLIADAHARGIYVIFDIVLNHVGDVFEYRAGGQGDAMAPWRDAGTYEIRWRDANGAGRDDWAQIPPAPSDDAVVWPREFQRNEFFRRQGNAFDRPPAEQELGGDFYTLKELVTEYVEVTPERGRYFPVRDALIRVYQYLIAKYDVDGYRVDTLKYVEPEFAQIFGEAIREYAQSIGKKNFFVFGEVYDDETKIALFVGRNAAEAGDTLGVDAALDFPLFYKLPQVAKGMTAPSEIARVFERRKQAQRGIISSHGDASRYFVTFLDNHDQTQRFYYSDPTDPARYDDQLTLGVGLLLALQGIPCLYYGTEQGLSSQGQRPEAVREALWGKPNAFDRNHPFYQAIQRLAAVRASQPALRYGRQYFRPLSGDGVHFGISTLGRGVLALSRILQDQEALIVANTNADGGWQGEVIVDFAISTSVGKFRQVYSNKNIPVGIERAVNGKGAGAVEIHEPDGAVTPGPARTLRVELDAMELQIWRR